MSNHPSRHHHPLKQHLHRPVHLPKLLQYHNDRKLSKLHPIPYEAYPTGKYLLCDHTERHLAATTNDYITHAFAHNEQNCLLQSVVYTQEAHHDLHDDHDAPREHPLRLFPHKHHPPSIHRQRKPQHFLPLQKTRTTNHAPMHEGFPYYAPPHGSTNASSTHTPHDREPHPDEHKPSHKTDDFPSIGATTLHQPPRRVFHATWTTRQRSLS